MRLIFSGERFDFVVATNLTVGNYWMQGWPIGECGEMAAVYAMLRYEGADEIEPTANKDSFNSETVSVVDLAVCRLRHKTEISGFKMF